MMRVRDLTCNAEFPAVDDDRFMKSVLALFCRVAASSNRSCDACVVQRQGRSFRRIDLFAVRFNALVVSGRSRKKCVDLW